MSFLFSLLVSVILFKRLLRITIGLEKSAPLPSSLSFFLSWALSSNGSNISSFSFNFSYNFWICSSNRSFSSSYFAWSAIILLLVSSAILVTAWYPWFLSSAFLLDFLINLSYFWHWFYEEVISFLSVSISLLRPSFLALVMLSLIFSLLTLLWDDEILILVYLSCNCVGLNYLTFYSLSTNSDLTYLICSSIMVRWLFSCSSL